MAKSRNYRGYYGFTSQQCKTTVRQYLKQSKVVNPWIILDSFDLVVGSSGTLLLPLFNLDSAKGISFDLKYSPSQMGALTEAPGCIPFTEE